MLQVRKKTGLVQEFNPNNIISSICENTKIELSNYKKNRIIELVLDRVRDREVIDTKELQSIIKESLSEVDYDIARLYNI